MKDTIVNALTDILRDNGCLASIVAEFQKSADSQIVREVLKNIIENKKNYSYHELKNISVALRQIAPKDLFVKQVTEDYIREDIPPWHWSMLNDELRNMTYATAIENCITSHSIVFEIGTGTGLLAILAAKAGASHVYSCEANPYLAQVAAHNVKLAGLSEKITIINKPAQEILLGEDIPTKCNVLLHEVMSGDIVGEGIVEVIDEMGQYILEQNATCLPNRIWANVQATRDYGLNSKHTFTKFQDIDLSEINMLSPATIRLSSVDTKQLVGPIYQMLKFEIINNKFHKTVINGIPLSILRSVGAIGVVQWLGFAFPDGSQHESAPGTLSHWRFRYHPINLDQIGNKCRYLKCDHFDHRLIFFDSP